MDFDTSLTLEQNGASVNYGVMFGNESIVFIKGGAGSSCYGYEDKYLRMARRVNDKSGYTVITASNPGPKIDTYSLDKILIDNYILQNELKSYSLSLVGSSNGAYQNIFLASISEKVKKIVCVNMPLMLNFQKSTTRLDTLRDIEKIFVYGSLDPSVKFIPHLCAKNIEGLSVKTVKNADHNFKGMLDSFIELSDIII